MTSNQKLNGWVKEWADLCQPDKIHWCDGSDKENQMLLDIMVSKRNRHKAQRRQTSGKLLFPE